MRAARGRGRLPPKATTTVLCLLALLWTSVADAFVGPTAAVRGHRIGAPVVVSRSIPAASSTADSDNNDDKEPLFEGGRIVVEVRKQISFPPGYFHAGSEGDGPLAVASDRVREAWMEYHWRKGGGLPIAIIEKQKEVDETDGKKRVIAPIMMEEMISSFPIRAGMSEASGSDAVLELEYKVTSPGPFFGPDLVTGSHIGRVSFVSSYSPTSADDSDDNENMKAITTSLVWKVEFDAIRLRKLYQRVTEFTIGVAATTVQEAVAVPRLLTLRTRLLVPSSGDGGDPAHLARSEWLDFLFSSVGGGLPLPPPIPFGEVLPEGGGMARKKLFRFPPGLIETAMVDETANANSDDREAVAYYQLENPGWWTLPFLVHTHLGRATFREASSESSPSEEADSPQHPVDLNWEIEIRSYVFAAAFVEKLTEMTVSTIVRNLRVKLQSPAGAVVPIKPPRGAGGQRLGSVPKATWVGRVLEAHLSDTRSTPEQLASLLAPWTWGNSGTGRKGEDDVEFGWSDSKME